MRAFAILLAFVPSLAIADVPPPPAAPQISNLAGKVARALTNNDTGSYERLLANDLEVWIDGRKAASTSAEWLRTFKPKLATHGVRYRVDRVLAGDHSFVLVTQFDSRGSFPLGHQECCKMFEISQYEVKSARIAVIRTMTTGSSDLTATSGR